MGFGRRIRACGTSWIGRCRSGIWMIVVVLRPKGRAEIERPHAWGSRLGWRRRETSWGEVPESQLADPCLLAVLPTGGGLRLSLSVSLLKVSEPAPEAPVLADQGFPRGANCFHVLVLQCHTHSLLMVWLRVTLGMVSGDTSSGARQRACRQAASKCACAIGFAKCA